MNEGRYPVCGDDGATVIKISRGVLRGVGKGAAYSQPAAWVGSEPSMPQLSEEICFG